MKVTKIQELFLRYIFLLLIGIFNQQIFTFIFTLLTIYPSYWIYHLFNQTAVLSGNTIQFNNIYAEITTACVASAAYFFLLILNLTTPIDLKKRISSLAFLFLSFLILNII